MSDDKVLASLRELLAGNGIGYYLVLTQDEHDSEYVSDTDKRREFISGFNGSAGTAIIGQHYAELATDGRYYLAAGDQLSASWTLRKEGTPGVTTWALAIAARAAEEKVDIGVDPRLIAYSAAKVISDKLSGSGASLRPITSNLIDKVWANKPPQPDAPVYALSDTVTGQSSASKIAQLRNTLRAGKVSAIVLSALDEIAWLFNLRGADISYNPVFKAFAIVTVNGGISLYINSSRLEAKPEGVELRPYEAVFDDVAQLASEENSHLWVPSGSSWAMVMAAEKARLTMTLSPVAKAKAVKNAVEIDGAKEAQVKCGLAIVKYLRWLENETRERDVTEYEGSQKLLEIRKTLPDFRGESFATISSTGANAAIIHYEPPVENSAVISRDKVYLLDTGCQFTHGTTDTTRTVHFGKPTHEERVAYTMVLKGHIALARIVFPQGSYGYQLDPIARQHLWSRGLDYRHGTGHGVGSFLNVHEGPIGISSNPRQSMNATLEVGNIISNEPGYYEDGKFGIRIESLVVVQPVKTEHRFGNKEYYGFDTITLVPLDHSLIDEDLLTSEEAHWINIYHTKVKTQLWPHLDEEEKRFVELHTQVIHARARYHDEIRRFES